MHLKSIQNNTPQLLHFSDYYYCYYYCFYYMVYNTPVYNFESNFIFKFYFKPKIFTYTYIKVYSKTTFVYNFIVCAIAIVIEKQILYNHNIIKV